MQEPPKLEDIFTLKAEAQADLTLGAPTVAEYAKKLDGQVIRYNALMMAAERNQAVLIEALEMAQTRYKKLEQRYKAPWKRRVKNFLISIGWYQPSREELEDIHAGR